MFKTFLTISALLCSALAAANVNINTASAEQLAAQIDGVGPVVAQRIVAHREQVGRFSQPADLAAVKGVGERILEKNRELLRVD